MDIEIFAPAADGTLSIYTHTIEDECARILIIDRAPPGDRMKLWGFMPNGRQVYVSKVTAVHNAVIEG